MSATRRQRTYDPATKARARDLREAGCTYQEINEALGGNIPKSTLSNWVSDVLLTPEQRQRIAEKEREGAARGRQGGIWGGAAGWNREQKRCRIKTARQQAEPIAKRLAHDEEALMLMAAALYLGEGAKDEDAFSFANSDPRIIQAWMALLRGNFEIDENKFACQVHVTKDMNLEEAQQFWSGVTGISPSHFIKGSVDKRQGSGNKRRPGYKGVCIVHYYSLALKRYLEALAQGVIDELLSDESNRMGP